jgi:hypothetical protein
MKRYKCHKEVRAAKIAWADPTKDRVGVEGQESSVDCPPGMFERFVPKPGDYLVQYEDGYLSFSPKKAFEDGYTLIPERPSFDEALAADTAKRASERGR